MTKLQKWPLVLMVAASLAAAQQGEDRELRAQRMLAMQNPLDGSDSVWIDELNYLEVRDRIADGVSIAIVSTGGIEENGPYLAANKHNVIMRAMCPAIAEELGNALCAPIVAFVPEGDFDPPSGAMLFPGSFSVRDETYHALLVDIGDSLKLHGFSDIVLIGDSGGNQRGLAAAAKTLNEKWQDSDVQAHFVPEFYSSGWSETEKYTEEVLGVREGEHDGNHDDIWVTAMMMVTDPSSVRYKARVAAGLASINGIDISDLEETVELGRKMVRFRAAHTAEAIRAHIGQSVVIDTATGAVDEQAVATMVRDLIDEYALSPWMFTHRILIDRNTSIPHSHPVLTLNTRYVDDRMELLTNIIHEQLHWFVLEHQAALGAAIRAVRERYPDAPDGPPAGARNLDSTYLHLVVCALEYLALEEKLGRQAAAAKLRAKPYYTWVFGAVVDDRDALRDILSASGLDLP